MLVIDLTPATPYKLKTTGTGWGTDNPTYTVEVFDSLGASLGTTGPLAFFQYSPPESGLNRVDFSNRFGGGGGVTVDEVSLDGQVLDASPPPPPFITSTSLNGSNEFEVIIEGLVLGRTYNLQRDPDLNSGFTTMVDSVVAGSDSETLTDDTPLPGKAFYRVED